jgi:hypothetical protein
MKVKQRFIFMFGINKSQVFQAMFPDKYPVSDIPISLSTSLPFTDKDKIFWEAEVEESTLEQPMN